MTYTNEQKMFIIDLAKKGMKYSQITQEFNKKFNENKTVNTIGTMAKKWGVNREESYHHYSDEEKAFIIDLILNKNMKYSRITQEFNKKFNKNTKETNIRTMASLWKVKKDYFDYYTDEEKQFISDLVINKKMRYHDIVPLYNKKFNKNRNIKQLAYIGRKSGAVNCNPYQPNPRTYTDEETNFIVEMLVDNGLSYKQLTPLFNKKFNKNVSPSRLQGIGYKLGLKSPHKHKTIMKSDYYDFYENQLPVGTVKEVRQNHNSILKIKIKMIPKELLKESELSNFIHNSEYWKPYSHYIYENYYNVKVKPNEHILYLDNNKLNTNIDNLICVNLGAIGYARFNGFLESDKDTKRIGLKLGKLNSILKQGEKNDI